MSNTIACPECKFEFEPTEAISNQLRDEIRREVEKDVNVKRDQLVKREREAATRESALAEQERSVEERVSKQVEAGRAKLMTVAAAKAKEDLAVELEDRDGREAELRKELKKTQANELALRKRDRELTEEKDRWELDKARELDQERATIQAEAGRKADEKYELRIKEQELKNADLVKQLADAQRRAEQGSQQTQGEVQEIVLEEILTDTFPTDGITEVAKGVRGADVMQQVRTPAGSDAGTILWESKRTKKWSNDWLAKLRTDQREAKADVTVLVSTALPEGVDTFEQIDGVWVCGWAFAASLAMALRSGLLETAKARQALAGQQGKMEQVYNYLASSEFRNRVGGIVEAFVTMQKDLEAEKRTITKHWGKREKQIQAAIANTAGMYGNLQGIIGGGLPEIEGMDMMMLEARA